MKTIPVKSILSPFREHGWFGSNYTVNLYRGCNHGCIYCDSRSECYGLDHFDIVFAKEDAITIFENELRSKRRKGLVLTGAMGDPYNQYEAKEKLTRSMLQALERYGFGIALLTKSALVTRDIDLFQKISSHLPCGVSITITTADDMLAKKIEPKVSPPSKRFAALKELSKKDIPAGITLMPTLPFITDTLDGVSEIVERAAAAGAAWVHAGEKMAVSLRGRQRAYFYMQLEEHFPGLMEQYVEQFGNRYWCETQNKKLWNHLVSECERYGLAYTMPEIEALIRRNTERQMTLF
jgi:DNA repair photolyase